MRRVLLICITLLITQLSAQNSWTWDDEVFALNVTQIDEFIKRFNGDQGPHLKRKKRNSFVKPLSRKDLVLSLFDRSASIERQSLETFINNLEADSNKNFISFYDDNWYARLECKIMYLGKPEKVVLTLKVESDEDYSAKWVIRGIDAEFLRLNIKEDENLFLHPASEGTNFINIRELFSADKRKVKGFMYQNFHEGKIALFLNELIEGNIEYEYIEQITYHFLQIDNWAFMVHSVARQDPNSGWLISDIIQLDDAQKKEYKKNILYLD